MKTSAAVAEPSPVADVSSFVASGCRSPTMWSIAAASSRTSASSRSAKRWSIECRAIVATVAV